MTVRYEMLSPGFILSVYEILFSDTLFFTFIQKYDIYLIIILLCFFSPPKMM